MDITSRIFNVLCELARLARTLFTNGVYFIALCAQPCGDQRWSTFVANHAKVIVACDFLTVVTATFKCKYSV